MTRLWFILTSPNISFVDCHKKLAWLYQFCIYLQLGNYILYKWHVMYTMINSCHDRHSIVWDKYPPQRLFAYHMNKIFRWLWLPLKALPGVSPFDHPVSKNDSKQLHVVDFDRWYRHNVIIKTVSTNARKCACHLRSTPQYHTECCSHIHIENKYLEWP